MKRSKILDMDKHIEDTNQQFENASPEEKRVIIAQDVIDRLNADLLIANPGSMMKGVSLMGEELNWADSFKTYINRKSCKVCAKGALFCSVIGRVNKISIDDAVSATEGNHYDDAAHMKLRELFTLEQLDLIETAFEGTSYIGEHTQITSEESEIARTYFYKFIIARERMIAICENIIENKGEFKPIFYDVPEIEEQVEEEDTF